jgi:hypothetical protein
MAYLIFYSRFKVSIPSLDTIWNNTHTHNTNYYCAWVLFPSTTSFNLQEFNRFITRTPT